MYFTGAEGRAAIRLSNARFLAVAWLALVAAGYNESRPCLLRLKERPHAVPRSTVPQRLRSTAAYDRSRREGRRSAFVKSFGRREAYEVAEDRTREVEGGLWGFRDVSVVEAGSGAFVGCEPGGAGPMMARWGGFPTFESSFRVFEGSPMMLGPSISLAAALVPRREAVAVRAGSCAHPSGSG